MEPKKTEVHVIRKRNVGVPKFLRFLFQILEVEDEDVISWSHQGTAFQIRQPDELADKILPKYFKHNKVSSFQRQLNYFGFKKWTKTQTNICTFSHPFFLQTDKDMMKLIKRKERVNTTGRRHSTGMLPGSEAFGLAAAAAAASASAAEVRKTEGTPAELELGLELEARSDTLAQATTPQQQFLHLQKLAEARELSMRYPSQSARGKRKSLPHVLPPSFGDTLGVGVNINMIMLSMAPRRRDQQDLTH
ncbi:hypothetical protein JM18_008722 [Phytophthora kernoviae]|uniref:HSF-type DNA-binding domain-containing protein n=2 Tax=Phytophthora kernoviae TaxID=325452 RepID=A0A921V3N3_9STRA|nr:hypothetical protein G195_010173 [Phytophthora kernoviae 00238/432]KAG2511001.1 hypothetical protein JM18_008722 [Phytophthora kernoviae]